MERYRQRGNSKEYIDRKRKRFCSEIEYLKSITKKNWTLEKDEYIEDKLKKEKIYLKEREKICQK